MRTLVIGANSYVGRSLCEALAGAGHSLSALARSADGAEALSARGIAPVRGQLDRLTALTDGFSGYDTCVLCAFVRLGEEQAFVVEALRALAGTGKTFVFTSGTAVLASPAPAGEWNEDSFAEDDPFTTIAQQRIRAETERLVRAGSARGVRAMVIRPPLIWGRGGSRQVPWIFETARRSGAARYLGRGLNVYSHVHVDDLAQLYLAAIERGAPGALYHAVAGEENFRTLAEAVGEVTGGGARSAARAEMIELLGQTVVDVAFAVNSRSRCPRARAELGWRPEQVDLIADIRTGSYARRFSGQGQLDKQAR